MATPFAHAADMVAFFPVASEGCPDTWQIYGPARGFVIRGTDDNDMIGERIGASIEDGIPPSHLHGYQAAINFTSSKYLTRPGNDTRAHGSSAQISGQTAASDGGIPFIQYLICRESPDHDHSIYLPENSVQWFAGDSCPVDWQTYGPALAGQGQTLVPLPGDSQASDNGALVDSGAGSLSHSHQIKISKTGASAPDALNIGLTQADTRWDWLGWLFAFTNRYFATSVVESNAVSDIGVRTDSDVLVPYTYLRPCVKKSDTRNTTKLPKGLGSFTTGFGCPTGFNRVTAASGRFLVGLPEQRTQQPRPESGKAFGGATLRSKQQPSHQHRVETTLKVSKETFDSAGIIRANHTRALMYTDDAKVSGLTVGQSINIPYVQLRFCYIADHDLGSR